MLVAKELIQYAKKHNLELPYEIAPLLEQSLIYIDELKNPKLINNECSICKKLNPENADYCCHCGSSLNITKISPDLLQSKNKDSNHPKSDSTFKVISIKFYFTILKSSRINIENVSEEIKKILVQNKHHSHIIIEQ